ncbi:MAG: GTP-dependent dephospho-CoA kinase family protein [Thermoplasmata archaeon]
MRVPLGPIVDAQELPGLLGKARPLVTVGDVVTSTLLAAGIRPELAVFDFKTKRKERVGLEFFLERAGGEVLRAPNPAGTLTQELWSAIERGIRLAQEGRSACVVVEGEEDLAAIPAILLAPDGAVVLYGMPGKGVVVVRVDGTSRARARGLLELLVPGERDSSAGD